MRKPLLLLLVALVLGPMLGMAPAAAHVDVEGSNPKDGAKLDEMPSVISIDFGGKLTRSPNIVVTRGKDGVVPTSKVRLDEGTAFVNVLGAPGGGTYEVAYRAVGKDSHPVSGTIEFTVSGDPNPLVAPSTKTASEEPVGGLSWPILILIFVAAAAAGVGASVWVSRRER